MDYRNTSAKYMYLESLWTTRFQAIVLQVPWILVVEEVLLYHHHSHPPLHCQRQLRLTPSCLCERTMGYVHVLYTNKYMYVPSLQGLLWRPQWTSPDSSTYTQVSQLFQSGACILFLSDGTYTFHLSIPSTCIQHRHIQTNSFHAGSWLSLVGRGQESKMQLTWTGRVHALNDGMMSHPSKQRHTHQ